MNAFHVIGSIFGLWAVAVAIIGIRRHDWPNNRGTERVVMAVSALLFVAAVGAAIITAATEEHDAEHPTESQSRETHE